MTTINTCIADHKKIISGFFVKIRTWIWWKRHNHCQEKNDN